MFYDTYRKKLKIEIKIKGKLKLTFDASELDPKRNYKMIRPLRLGTGHKLSLYIKHIK